MFIIKIISCISKVINETHLLSERCKRAIVSWQTWTTIPITILKELSSYSTVITDSAKNSINLILKASKSHNFTKHVCITDLGGKETVSCKFYNLCCFCRHEVNLWFSYLNRMIHFRQLIIDIIIISTNQNHISSLKISNNCSLCNKFWIIKYVDSIFIQCILE